MGCDYLFTYPIDPALAEWAIAEDAAEYPSTTPAPPRITANDGEVLRLASALVTGARIASADRKASLKKLKRYCAKAVGSVADSDITRDGTQYRDEEIGPRLMVLTPESTRHLSQQLELLALFADKELYKKDGCRSMVQWMNVHLHMGRVASSEHLRVGRAHR